MERARQAVTKAAEELSRVESAERQPVQRSREAHARVSTAKTGAPPRSDSRAQDTPNASPSQKGVIP